MRLSKSVLTFAIATFALVAAPAHAQHRGGGGRVGGAGGARASAPRGAAPRAVFAPRASGMGPRFGSSRMARPAFASPRFSAARVAGPRAFAVGSRPAFAQRGVIGTRGFAGPRGFAPRVIGPRIGVSPFRFSRPFYAFRPRFSLAFGLWAGFPVAYPYYYDYPYSYGYPYGYPPYPYPYAGAYAYPSAAYGYPDPSYGYPSTYPAQNYPAQSYPTQSYPAQPYPAQAYPPSGSIGAQPGQDSGGVSFEISPNTARVIVDGTDVGTVAEFSPTSMPLTLTAGRHHVELRVAGYQTMSFDAEIVAGQVIPYRGAMQPTR
jgi:hypothetical protein